MNVRKAISGYLHFVVALATFLIFVFALYFKTNLSIDCKAKEPGPSESDVRGEFIVLLRPLDRIPNGKYYAGMLFLPCSFRARKSSSFYFDRLFKVKLDNFVITIL